MTFRVQPRILAALLLGGALTPGLAAQNWPSFRGPGASGIADGQELPATWDVASGRNVRWRTPIPGLGHSSPVVWGDRVYVTTSVADAIPDLALGETGGIDLAEDRQAHSWRVLCLSATDGRVLWQREVWSGMPRARRHVKASQANATPATDGKTVVAILGSEGLVALDAGDGRVLWQSDLGHLNPGLYGDAASEWGHASSPVIFEDRVIVQVDRHRDSYLAAFDLASGEQLWKVPRTELPVWATPTLHTAAGRPEVVVVGGNHTRGYDPRTGEEIWRFHDFAEVKTPTPILADGLIILAGGYRGRPIYALRAGGRGDLSVPEGGTKGEYLAWRTEPGGPYTCTPLAYRGLLYAVRDIGVLHVYDLDSGQRIYSERTGSTHAASPVASDGKIYITGETGEILVVKAGRAFEVLGRNDMGEPCMATPAIAGGTLFVRTRGHLYAIGAEASPPPPPRTAPPASPR